MAGRTKRPAPDTPALIDLRVLLAAAVMASPAAYLASQGLLSVDQALTRFVVVLVACTAVTALLRALWPLVAGEPEAQPTAGTTHSTVVPSPGAETTET